MRRKRKYTKKDLIEALQRWVLQHGKSPTHWEWDNDPNTPTSKTIREHFGKWQTWISTAKLPAKKKKPPMRAEPAPTAKLTG
jgi:hypothetical protein